MKTDLFSRRDAFPKLQWLLAVCITVSGSAASGNYAASQTQARTAGGTPLKIGFVDSQIIIQQYPEAQEAQKKIQASIERWQTQLDTMIRAHQSRVEEYDKKKAMLNEAAKLAEEQKLLEQQQKILEFRNKKFGQGGELQELQERTMTPVRQKILKAIEVVAAEEGMSFIFDKGAEVPVLLHGDNKYDVTFKVLDRLKRGK